MSAERGTPSEKAQEAPRAPEAVEPEPDHVSYTLDMPLEQIERLEREKAAMMREHQKVPLAPRIAVEAQDNGEGVQTTPAALAQPPVIGVSPDGGRLLIPGVPVAPKVVEQASGPLVIPNRTAEVNALDASGARSDMPQGSALEVAGGRPAVQCSNRCDVRNGGSEFYHCHACQRHWRNGEVVARGPQRMTVAQ